MFATNPCFALFSSVHQPPLLRPVVVVSSFSLYGGLYGCFPSLFGSVTRPLVLYGCYS